MESKQNLVYFFHTSGTRVNSEQRSLGEKRKKGEIKTTVHCTQLKLVKILFILDKVSHSVMSDSW